MTARPKAYSYLRFSTAAQLEGDSFRRQTAMAREYAERHGLELADLTFRDLGVSAFRGKNAVEGALGAFLAAIEAGKVKPGDYLLVESLDRLSRDRIMAALNRFHDLLQSGVRVVTLMDGQTYDEKSLDNLQPHQPQQVPNSLAEQLQKPRSLSRPIQSRVSGAQILYVRD